MEITKITRYFLERGMLLFYAIFVAGYLASLRDVRFIKASFNAGAASSELIYDTSKL